MHHILTANFHIGIQGSHVLVWQLKLVTCWLPHWYSGKPCVGLAIETGHLLTSTLVFREAMCWFGNWNWSPVDFHTGIQGSCVLVWQLKLVTCWLPHWYSVKPCAGLATETGHLLTSTLVFSKAMCWFGNWNWPPASLLAKSQNQTECRLREQTPQWHCWCWLNHRARLNADSESRHHNDSADAG